MSIVARRILHRQGLHAKGLEICHGTGVGFYQQCRVSLFPRRTFRCPQ